MQNATTLRVHRGGVPQHVQVYVHPGGVACDYLDDDGNVLASAVHDKGSVSQIAETKGLEIEEVDHGADEPKTPTEIAAETNAADRAPAEEPAEEEPFDPAKHNVDDVVDYLRSVEDDEDEWSRVIAAEKDGKARAGVLDEQE